VETTDPAHIEQLLASLRKAGIAIE
jgi:hypothetical protein